MATSNITTSADEATIIILYQAKSLLLTTHKYAFRLRTDTNPYAFRRSQEKTAPKAMFSGWGDYSCHFFLLPYRFHCCNGYPHVKRCTLGYLSGRRIFNIVDKLLLIWESSPTQAVIFCGTTVVLDCVDNAEDLLQSLWAYCSHFIELCSLDAGGDQWTWWPD